MPAPAPPPQLEQQAEERQGGNVCTSTCNVYGLFWSCLVFLRHLLILSIYVT